MTKRRRGWYVVQVMGGRENAVAAAIERACADATCSVAGSTDDVPLLEECFCPSFVHRLKYMGTWRNVERPLLPGYVVAVTPDPNALRNRLHKVREFTRVLTLAETFVPLGEEERTWIESSTSRDDRVIPISIGYREGDRLVVSSGPLQGREAMIIRVIRKKCLAVVQMNVGGKRVTTTVGLAIVPKDQQEGMQST